MLCAIALNHFSMYCNEITRKCKVCKQTSVHRVMLIIDTLLFGL